LKFWGAMRPTLRGSAGPARQRSAPAPSRTTISVLIVDDDELVAEVLAACCDEDDLHVVATVYNADDALMAAQSAAPDVALVDRRLAGTSGLDLARELLKVAPALKVVIITADPSPEVEQAALAAGCVACVGKTMTVGDLLPDLVRRVYGAGTGVSPDSPHPHG
jgi:DNA-binding NarL/FixJ family response regulator